MAGRLTSTTRITEEGLVVANFTLFNDIKRIVRSSRLETESTTTIFGDVKLDLTQATLERGDHQMRILTVFGDVKLRLPEWIGVNIDASTVFSELEIETVSQNTEEKPGGSWISENFDRAPVRVYLSIQGIFGDIDIVRMPVAAPNQPAQIGETIVYDESPSYEGQTHKLDH
jgi:predicted membrane protein